MRLLTSILEIVAVSIAIGAILTLGVRRAFGERERLLSNDGGSPALRAITATYALLLAFVLVVSLQSFENARQKSVTEADAVVSLSNSTLLLPAPSRKHVGRALACYAQTVVDREFPTMATGRPVSDDDAALKAIYTSLPNPTHAPAAQTSVETVFLGQLSALTTARDARIRSARSNLPPLLWVVVLGGAIVVLLALSAITFVDRPWPQMWLLSGATAIIVGASGNFVGEIAERVFAGRWAG